MPDGYHYADGEPMNGTADVLDLIGETWGATSPGWPCPSSGCLPTSSR
ncbi:hypothetical protein ACFQ0B_40845 [Nonomuraea thailandensis]